jgi:hypothetical protein
MGGGGSNEESEDVEIANMEVWCTWHRRDCLKRFVVELGIEDRLLLRFE